MKKTFRKKGKAKKSRREKKIKTGSGGTNTDTKKKSQAKNLNQEQIEFLKLDRIINRAYYDIRKQLDILEDILF